MTRISREDLDQMDARLDAAVAAAQRTGGHVWIVATAYLISGETADHIARSGKAPDGTVLSVADAIGMELGCYLCEEPLTRAAHAQRCPGSPS